MFDYYIKKVCLVVGISVLFFRYYIIDYAMNEYIFISEKNKLF